MMRDATATMRVEPMFPRNRRKVDLTDCLATSDPCSSRGGAIDSEEVKVSVFSTLGRFRTIYQFMKYLHCICIGSLFYDRLSSSINTICTEHSQNGSRFRQVNDALIDCSPSAIASEELLEGFWLSQSICMNSILAS